MNFALVFFGGGMGCVVRYLIGLGFQKTTATLPWATFLSNITACLVFALVVWIASTKEVMTPTLKLMLLTGFCGGLSTFSSFGYETFLLLKQSLYLYAFLNILISCSLCIFIFYIFN
ncbi:fluoride efflux transporter CrcB [Sphingobacteriaceae bacterium]|nr:fluoride efflux transporter CrcB [Sphingobacteriaceae bacterium]